MTFERFVPTAEQYIRMTCDSSVEFALSTHQEKIRHMREVWISQGEKLPIVMAKQAKSHGAYSFGFLLRTEAATVVLEPRFGRITHVRSVAAGWEPLTLGPILAGDCPLWVEVE